ncbi:hypothetical protein UF16_10480 [Chromobacterium violaceum]|nr:hypothetical protein UF16_10480 [Chromobacterium violaceum]
MTKTRSKIEMCLWHGFKLLASRFCDWRFYFYLIYDRVFMKLSITSYALIFRTYSKQGVWTMMAIIDA